MAETNAQLPSDDQIRLRVAVAARACFRRWGVKRSKMEDIAREADLSRPNLYNYFSNKEEVIGFAMLLYAIELNEHFEATLELKGHAGDLILERLVQGIVIASEDGYGRDLSLGLTGVSELYPEDVIAALGEFWTKLLDYAEQRGELRPGLDHARILDWFIYMQSVLLMNPGRWHDEQTLRSMLADFVVPAVVVDWNPRPVPTATGNAPRQRDQRSSNNRP